MTEDEKKVLQDRQTKGQLEWDANRNAFVVRGSKGGASGDEKERHYTEEEWAALDATEKKRIKNRRKKKRQKERRRKKNRTRRSQQADIQAVRTHVRGHSAVGSRQAD